MFGKLFGNQSESAENLKSKGNAALQRGDLAGAEAMYRLAIEADGGYMPAHYNLAHVLRVTGRMADALVAYELAAQIAPDDYEVHVNRGVTLNAMGRFNEAISVFDLAVRLAPNALEPLLNKGVALDRSGRHQEAIEAWSALLARDPSCSIARYYRSMAYLLLGRFKEGFLEYESRLDLPGFVPDDLLAGKEEWDGCALDGKTLLIYPEQGMGDMLQFLRYVTACKELGARTMVVCHPPLASILATVDAIDIVIPDGAPLPEDFDVYISVMSLPYALGHDRVAQPLALRVPVRPLAEITEARGLKVGVCWQGSRQHERDAERSIPKEVFWATLAGTGNVSFFSVQVDERCDGCVTALAHHMNDFHDSANLVQQLDLIVSVDTSIAHLSATLGVPTWVLVTHSPDWRWGMAGEATPWYPSVRIFRQPEPGDWNSVLAAVKACLQQGSI